METMTTTRSLRIEPIPDWWSDAFHDRQGVIRTRILARLEQAGEPMMLLQIQQYLTAYSTLEVSYAITTLVRWGDVEVHEQEIRVEGKFSTTIKTESFYTLARSGSGVPV